MIENAFLPSCVLLTVGWLRAVCRSATCWRASAPKGTEHSQVAPRVRHAHHRHRPAADGVAGAQDAPRSGCAIGWRSYGLDNARLEPWKFGRGWTLEKLTVEMIEPRYLPLIGYADGWSASTSGEIVAAPVFVGGKSARGGRRRCARSSKARSS